MNCNQAERAIIQHGGDLSPDVAGHLRGCRACRDLAVFHGVLLDLGVGKAPPAALDRAILDLAAAGTSRRRASRRLVFPRVFWSAAAAAVLVFGVVAALVLRGPAGGPAPEFSEWTKAVVDLDLIDLEVAEALAELSGQGEQNGDGATEGSPSADDLWDGLLELEFDVYFESERLRVGG